ncbi:hypothetical protein BDZ91DRAFT_796265 [Kalaharituber pfeilii]|nr:hypothetical protein BDZ91DRAFT_796265 [Kalaharituber pfeilii]
MKQFGWRKDLCLLIKSTIRFPQFAIGEQSRADPIPQLPSLSEIHGRIHIYTGGTGGGAGHPDKSTPDKWLNPQQDLEDLVPVLDGSGQAYWKSAQCCDLNNLGYTYEVLGDSSDHMSMEDVMNLFYGDEATRGRLRFGAPARDIGGPGECAGEPEFPPDIVFTARYGPNEICLFQLIDPFEIIPFEKLTLLQIDNVIRVKSPRLRPPPPVGGGFRGAPPGFRSLSKAVNAVPLRGITTGKPAGLHEGEELKL